MRMRKGGRGKRSFPRGGEQRACNQANVENRVVLKIKYRDSLAVRYFITSVSFLLLIKFVQFEYFEDKVDRDRQDEKIKEGRKKFTQSN